ncbi:MULTISPECIES: hypothetical protein [Sphingobacterium]|uniref:Uncharacterized protein n=1 Tax=Sphingobacterium multivorum TaxID=28454 RepID=A0A2X2JAV7_SPHMU|nr:MULTISPECIES: hypothetical protein [Sphingobacterium]MBB1645992.1 hypothetical protein [Sphingobacterium sp. UME9]OFV17665.1 hypothetical protein HMPREF3127_08125 [Sphingobacterium sp. HMSC13C05]QRQ61664.1 hypothetical protein I6J33_01290 [Sphingobacterium multivorum]SPZ84235.1 Uncharacterised protein [Sphingobacterium multivorum]
METFENIKLTTAFKQFCDLFGFSPEEVVQAFIDKIDIAEYMCDPIHPDRWANVFAMEYLIQYTQSENSIVEYGEFAEEWVKMMETNEGGDLVGKTRSLLDAWHKRVLEDRIHLIMKGDDGKDTA